MGAHGNTSSAWESGRGDHRVPVVARGHSGGQRGPRGVGAKCEWLGDRKLPVVARGHSGGQGGPRGANLVRRAARQGIRRNAIDPAEATEATPTISGREEAAATVKEITGQKNGCD